MEFCLHNLFFEENRPFSVRSAKILPVILFLQKLVCVNRAYTSIIDHGLFTSTQYAQVLFNNLSIKVTKPGKETTFTYDANGNQVRKIVTDTSGP